MAEPEYALGRTSSEYDRLAEQAELLRPVTERTLRAAGVTPGMRVLDVGCGTGDVSLLLREIVGAEGQVVGVDLDQRAVRVAEERCRTSGVMNATFIAADVRALDLRDKFDAAVGRLALMYMSDPTDALRAIAVHVRSGGIVAFLEWVAEISPRTLRDCPVLAGVQDLVRQTHARSGAFIEIGAELYSRMRDAGLSPEPRPLAEIVLAADQGSAVHRRWSLVVRSLLPKIIEYRLAKESEVVDIVERRLLEELTNARGLLPLSWPMVGQWSRKP